MRIAMPLYDYKCPECGYIWEEFKKMSHNHSNKNICPSCRSMNGKRYYGKQIPKIHGFKIIKDINGDISTQEIREKEKKGIHYMSQADQERTSNFYRKINEKEEKIKSEKTAETIMGEFKKRGVLNAT
mgnify:CR=1 FL=1